MIKIDIEYDLTVSRNELHNIPSHKAGIYIFFDKKDSPLYVGIASDLKARIGSHFAGNTHTYRFNHLFCKCSLIFEKDELKRKTIEYYLINSLKTRLNGQLRRFTDAIKKTIPKEKSCMGFTKHGKRCTLPAHENGYCHYHGGNGVTVTKLKVEAAEKAAQSFQVHYE